MPQVLSASLLLRMTPGGLLGGLYHLEALHPYRCHLLAGRCASPPEHVPGAHGLVPGGGGQQGLRGARRRAPRRGPRARPARPAAAPCAPPTRISGTCPASPRTPPAHAHDSHEHQARTVEHATQLCHVTARQTLRSGEFSSSPCCISRPDSLPMPVCLDSNRQPWPLHARCKVMHAQPESCMQACKQEHAAKGRHLAGGVDGEARRTARGWAWSWCGSCGSAAGPRRARCRPGWRSARRCRGQERDRSHRRGCAPRRSHSRSRWPPSTASPASSSASQGQYKSQSERTRNAFPDAQIHWRLSASLSTSNCCIACLHGTSQATAQGRMKSCCWQ